MNTKSEIGESALKAKFMGMELRAEALKCEKVNGKPSAIFEIHSRNLKERHRVLASFYRLILDINGEKMELFVKNAEGEVRKIRPHLERAQRILVKMKDVFEMPNPPKPTFSFSCKNCDFYRECVNWAIEAGDISMINGVGEGRKRALMKAGYKKVEDVANSDEDHLSKYLGIGIEEAKRIKMQAKALEFSKWFMVKGVNLKEKKYEYYFDVEKANGETYLLGLLSKEEEKLTYRYFILKEDWEKEWCDFLKAVRLHPTAPIYHYDVFDKKVIEKLAVLSHRHVKGVLKRMVDLYRLVHSSFILPVRFYSLKDVAHTLGFEWRIKSYNGYEAMMALEEWKNTHDEELLKTITLYNEDDCRALFVVKNRIVQIAKDVGLT